MKLTFQTGIKDSIPIALGYFAVSAAYGMAAIVQGLTVSEAICISLSNLTSAGQFAGTTLLALGASFVEIIITQIVINSRYLLMSLSLSQKLEPGTTIGQRMLVAFGITDEIYATTIGQKGKISWQYYAGLMVLPILGWTSGTALGAVASSVLPSNLVNALGIAMYGMFIAIFVPAARKSRPVCFCVLISIAASCLFAWTPGLRQLSSGYVVVFITIVCAGLCAWLFPVEQTNPPTGNQSKTEKGKEETA